MNLLETMARVSAERMLDCIVGGVAIAVFTWLLLRAVGRQNSGTRFAVWFCALIAIAALPFVASTSMSSAVRLRPAFTVPVSWAIYVFAAWLAIAVAGLARVAYSLWKVRRLRRSCTELANGDPEIKSSIAEIWKENRPQPRISVSDAVRAPVAIGFFKPMIILPAWAARELSPAELKAVLLHELAHLRRRDHWTNLAQKIVGALFFFHPAVWWIERQISLEREMACDDAVLAQLANPRAYAECLVSVAEKSFLQRGFALVQAAVSRARHMTQRIASILDAHRPAATGVSKPALLAVTGFAVMCISLTERAPRLVGFRDGYPPSRAVATNPDSVEPMSGVRIVPAAFHLDSGAPQQGAPSPGQARPMPKSKRQMPALIRTKATIRRPQQPMLVLTSAQQPVAPPQMLFVVMRSVESDGTGSLVWSLCVWRVIVTPENKVQMGIAAKSI